MCVVQRSNFAGATCDAAFHADDAKPLGTIQCMPTSKQLKTAATRNNYRKNDEKYARAVWVAIEFGWARLLVVTGTLPSMRFTKTFAIDIKTNTDVYLLKVHRDHMNVQVCYLPDNYA